MKLLLDQNISYRVISRIKTTFPFCESVKELSLWDQDDYEIWKFALLNEYCVVTFDEDFYNFNAVFDNCPKIIWFRTGNISNNQVAEILMIYKDTILDFLSGKLELSNNCLEIDRIGDL